MPLFCDILASPIKRISAGGFPEFPTRFLGEGPSDITGFPQASVFHSVPGKFFLNNPLELFESIPWECVDDAWQLFTETWDGKTHHGRMQQDLLKQCDVCLIYYAIHNCTLARAIVFLFSVLKIKTFLKIISFWWSFIEDSWRTALQMAVVC